MPNANAPGSNIVAGPRVNQTEEYFNVRNPLRRFRSWKYHWVITAHQTVDAALVAPTLAQRMAATCGMVINEPGSAEQGYVIVNEFTDVRSGVQSISWESLVSVNTDTTTGNIGGTLVLFEPYGVYLLAQMNDIVQLLQTSLVGNMVFAARVYFVGHGHAEGDGDQATQEVLTGYPDQDRPLIFTLLDMGVDFAQEGVTYTMSIMNVVNGSLGQAMYSPLAALQQERVARPMPESVPNDAAAQKLHDISIPIADALMNKSPPQGQVGKLIEDGYISLAQFQAIQKSVARLKVGERAWDVTRDNKVSVKLTNPHDGGKIVHVIAEVSPTPNGPPPTGPEKARIFALNAGGAISDQVSQFKQPAAPKAKPALTDTEDERIEAKEFRDTVMTGGTKTVGEGLKALENMLNEATASLAIQQGSSAAAARFKYVIVPEVKLAAMKLDNPAVLRSSHGGSVGDAEGTETTPDSVVFDANGTIFGMINTILQMSSEVCKAVDRSNPKDIKDLKTVRTRTAQKVMGEGNPTIIYLYVNLADSGNPHNFANVSSKAEINRLEFDYMYTNRYSDLLSFDMHLENWYISRNGYLKPQPHANVGAASATYNTTAADTDPATRRRTATQPHPIAQKAEQAGLPRETQSFLDAINGAMQIPNSTVKIKMMGDPYLAWDCMSDVSGYMSMTGDDEGDRQKLKKNGHYFGDHMLDPVRAEIRVNYPTFNEDLQKYTILPFWYSDPYVVYSITTSFNDSEGFTQELELMWSSEGITDKQTPTQ